jgi:hypothetical protein
MFVNNQHDRKLQKWPRLNLRAYASFSFFPRTKPEWNKLEDNVLSVDTVRGGHSDQQSTVTIEVTCTLRSII